MSLILNNLANVVESLIQNTLTPSRHELAYDIDDSNDNQNKEDDDNLSPGLVESKETNYAC
jgi:hypothetical protein